MIEYADGDLFDAGIPAVAQGVNLDGVMGAGIAAEFRRRYPGMYREYAALCSAGVLRLGSLHLWTYGEATVFNLATQRHPGPCAQLPAIRSSVRKMLRCAEVLSIPAVAVPRIGCGLGGLDWAQVNEVLTQATATSTVRLVVVTRKVVEAMKDKECSCRCQGCVQPPGYTQYHCGNNAFGCYK